MIPLNYFRLHPHQNKKKIKQFTSILPNNLKLTKVQFSLPVKNHNQDSIDESCVSNLALA